jgi:AraC family transcriptional regulator
MSPARTRDEYVARINRVIDHIESHLEEDLALSSLARVARFSPYHFHRIFRAMVGEPLNRFIQRLRVEKAANQLLANPKKSITEIALDCGFSGSQTFARAFREAFGMSASEWRADSKIGQTDSKIGQANGKGCEEEDGSLSYSGQQNTKPERRNAVKDANPRDTKKAEKIDVNELSEPQVAYVRHIGPYKGDSQLFSGLFGKLMQWAGPRGFLGGPDTQILAVYHDNPDVTDESKLRTSVCVSVPADTQAEGEIGRMSVPGGKYAVARFELMDTEYEAAWNHVMGEWLPQSGYQPDDRPCFERFLNNPEEHPQGKCIVDICVPVRPL